MKYTGIVADIREKTGRSARGPWTMYSLVLNTNDGDSIIGVGFDKPAVPLGGYISIEATTNAKGYLDGNPRSIEILKDQAPPAAVAAVASRGDDRQRSIVTQSAYKTAAHVLDSALQHGVIKLPAAKSAASDNLDVMLAALDQVAQHLYNKSIAGLEFEEQETSAVAEEGDYDPTA